MLRPVLHCERQTHCERQKCIKYHTQTLLGLDVKELAVSLALEDRAHTWTDMYRNEQLKADLSAANDMQKCVRIQFGIFLFFGFKKSQFWHSCWKKSWRLWWLVAQVSVPLWAAFSNWVNKSIKGKAIMKYLSLTDVGHRQEPCHPNKDLAVIRQKKKPTLSYFLYESG